VSDHSWKPSTASEVTLRLERDIAQLTPNQRAWLTPRLVRAKQVPVASDPPHSVVVVAETAGTVLYWSDVEEGWEVDLLSPEGSIDQRSSNQFTLAQALGEWQARLE